MSLHRLITLLCLLTAFLISHRGISQKGFTVTHYTDENGLPQNSVKGLAADSEGFIWIATENGLARFDGLTFYNFDKSVLGTQTNRFLPLQPSLSKDDKLEMSNGQPGRRIYATADFKTFIRIEKGVAKVDSLYYDRTVTKLPFFGQESYLTELSVGLPSWLKMISDPARQIIGDAYGLGSYYLVDSSSVRFYEGGKQQYQVAFRGTWSNYFLIKQTLYYLGNDGVLVKIGRQGVERLTIAGDLLRDYKSGSPFSGLEIYWNISNDQAFFDSGKGLYLLEAERNGQMYTKLVLEEFDLDEHKIHSVYRDPATQNLFLGSLSQGLYLLKKQPFHALLHADEHMDNVFYAQAEKDNKTVITPDGTIVIKDSLTGKVKIGTLPTLQEVNPLDKRSLFFDHKGMLWVKAGDFLYKMDHNAERVIQEWSLRKEIKHIHEDQNHIIWIATAISGIYTLDPDAKDAKPVKRHHSAKATYFVNDQKKVLAATTDGLYAFEAASGSYKLMEHTKGLYIKSVHVDDQGGIWMTANEEGILFYNRNKLYRFPLDKNKYLASPHCIVDDGKGFFWIPTDKGLFQVSVRDLRDYVKSPSQLFYQYHAKDEGFRTNEFNGGCQPCGLRLADGVISLPSLMGLVRFDPGEIPLNVPDKAIVLDKTRVNNELIDVTEDTLVLPADPVQTQFYFSTPYFGNPYNLNISYALVDLDEKVLPSDWIPIPPTDFSITFSNLNYGKHQLLVRKVNGFGKNNYTIRKIVLIVPPLWYQTLWAKILGVIFVLFCIFLYNRFRLRKISEENAKLEDLVERRTERLNDVLRDIEGSKNEMSRQVHMLSRLLTSMTHDIQSPLNYIWLTSNSIPDMVKKGDLETVSELGLVIADSSQRMGDLLRGLLDYIKVYVYGNSLQFEPVRLRELVDNKFEIFRNGIEMNGSSFQNDVPEDLTVSSDQQMLAIMVHNLMDNAMKFTHRGTIRVYAETDGEQEVRLLITNPGRGIGDQLLEFINADQEDKKDMIRPYGRNTGLGLLIVKEIAEIIQVGLYVKQTDSTCFTLTFRNH